MLVGDAAAWATRFTTFDERFLERIVEVWPSCIAVLPSQPDEDAVTINLVHHLWKDSIVRRLCHSIEYQYEPFGLAADGSRYSKGKIDLAALFDWERGRYLAYECKRLNVTTTGSRSSLATAYVQRGMMRFITEQYAQDLPLGCMLGYVMDGDFAFATRRLETAIRGHLPVALRDGPSTIASVRSVPRFKTSHIRAGGALIEIRHALLSFGTCP
jgi:hypothetical protein